MKSGPLSAARNWSVVWRWGVTLALLCLVARVVPMREIGAAVARAAPLWLWIALVPALAAQAAQALRLGWLVRGCGLRWSTHELMEVHFTSLAYALVLPAGNFVALALRGYRIGLPEGRWGLVGKIMLADRAASLLGAVITGLACLPWTARVPSGVGWGLAAVLVAGIVALIVLKPPELRWGLVARATALSVAINAVGISAYGAVACALGMSMDIFGLGVGRAAMLVAAVLPVSVAGLGLREGTAAVVLGRMGALPAEAVALSLLAFTVTVAVPALVGAGMGLAGAWRGGRVPQAAVDDDSGG